MKNNFLFSLLIGALCTVNTLSATKITPIIYALNTHGEVYANVNGTWSKGPSLPMFGNSNKLPILTLAAGPSVERTDGIQQGQLYALDSFHGLWSMQEVSLAQPFGGNSSDKWEHTHNPSLSGIAVGKNQLIGFMYRKEKALSFIWEKQNLATKGVFDKNWAVDTNADANFVALSPDLPATAFHVGYRYRFLVWERGYNKPFYAQLGKTGWIEIDQKFKKIYAGAEGSCIGIDKDGRMYANQQIFGPQSAWVELVPPQLTSITTIENANDADQWTLTSGQEKLAFGLTTNNAGEIINEIMMSALLTCQHKNDLTKRVVNNVLWRRTGITTKNRFGLGWELVSLNSETEAPGLITALTIGSFDQTKEVEKAQREAAEAQAAAQKLENDKKIAAQTATAKKAKIEKDKKDKDQKAAAKAAALKKAKNSSRFKPAQSKTTNP